MRLILQILIFITRWPYRFWELCLINNESCKTAMKTIMNFCPDNLKILNFLNPITFTIVNDIDFMKENIRVCKHFTISPSGLTLLTRLAPIFIYVYYLYYLYLLWKLHCGFLGIVKRQFFKPNAIQKFWDMFRKFTICFDHIFKMNVLPFCYRESFFCLLFPWHIS